MTTTTIRVGAAVAADLAARDLADVADYDGTPNPYNAISYRGGLVTLTLPQLAELHAEAEASADDVGPLADRPQLRTACRRLADTIAEHVDAATLAELHADARRVAARVAAERPPVEPYQWTPPPPLWSVRDEYGEPTLLRDGEPVASFVVRRRVVLAVVDGVVVDEAPLDEWAALVARLAAR